MGVDGRPIACTGEGIGDSGLTGCGVEGMDGGLTSFAVEGIGDPG